MKLYNNICIACWENENLCNCLDLNRKFIKIDANISNVICTLNKHDLFTEFCCGGHTEKKFSFIYIHFKENYLFDILPEGFVYKNRTLFHRNSKLKTVKEIQKDINDYIKILDIWVNEVLIK
jgi:hypothetical protein